LRDLRAGKIAPISFETPADHPDAFAEELPPPQSARPAEAGEASAQSDSPPTGSSSPD
jgi:hypothetical protein